MGRGGWVYLGYLINLQHQWIHNLPIFHNWVLQFIHRVPPSNINMWWFACGILAFTAMLLNSSFGFFTCQKGMWARFRLWTGAREILFCHGDPKLSDPSKWMDYLLEGMVGICSAGLWTLKWPKTMSFFLFIERMKDRKAYPLAPRKPLHTFRIVSYPNDLW